MDFSLILAVCMHKVPEGLALGALLLGAGFSRAKTLIRVAAVEYTTLLGGVVGMVFLPQMSAFWLDAIVAHVGGGFCDCTLARSHAPDILFSTVPSPTC
jgi:zinc transporter ZupT